MTNAVRRSIVRDVRVFCVGFVWAAVVVLAVPMFAQGIKPASPTTGVYVAPAPYINGSGTPVGPIVAATGCTAPPYTFSGSLTSGLCSAATNSVSLEAGATEVTRATTTQFQVLVNQLPLGGTTASFPMLKRSSAQIQFRLADDSGFAYGRVAGFLFGSGSTFDDTGDGTFRFTDSNGNNGVTHVVTTDGTDYCKSRAGADTCTVKSNLLVATSNIVGGDTVRPSGNTRGGVRSSADGLIEAQNNANNIGVQFSTGTAAPTVGTCGTGAIKANSRNTAGGFTATGAAACTVTFGAGSFTNTPNCTITPTKAPTTVPYISTESNAAFTVSGMTAGDNLTVDFVCVGGV